MVSYSRVPVFLLNKLKQKLFFFGVGNAANAVASFAASEFSLIGTTRNSQKIRQLEDAQIEPVLLEDDLSKVDLPKLRTYLQDAYVLVSYPPDSTSDNQFAPLTEKAKAIIYISSTGVYGRKNGIVDKTTPEDVNYEPAKARLESERVWRRYGAITLRAPGLYGPTTGLHIRLKDGTYKLPGDGSRYTSRLHLSDLARLIMAAFKRPLPRGSIYVVGDLEPTTQKEAVHWLCAKMNLPLPPSMPLDLVSPTLRGNRQVSPACILAELGIKLDFPTYREGFSHCLGIFEAKAEP